MKREIRNEFGMEYKEKKKQFGTCCVQDKLRLLDLDSCWCVLSEP